MMCGNHRCPKPLHAVIVDKAVLFQWFQGLVYLWRGPSDLPGTEKKAGETSHMDKERKTETWVNQKINIITVEPHYNADVWVKGFNPSFK